jgi:hypothetical protein
MTWASLTDRTARDAANWCYTELGFQGPVESRSSVAHSTEQGGSTWSRAPDRVQPRRPAGSPTCRRLGDFAEPFPDNQCGHSTRATSCLADRTWDWSRSIPEPPSRLAATWLVSGTEGMWRRGGEAPRCVWDHRDHSRPTVPVRVLLRHSSFEVTSVMSECGRNQSAVCRGVGGTRQRSGGKSLRVKLRVTSWPAFESRLPEIVDGLRPVASGLWLPCGQGWQRSRWWRTLPDHAGPGPCGTVQRSH